MDQYLYVVSDAFGYVVSFKTLEETKIVFEKYPTIPFVIHKHCTLPPNEPFEDGTPAVWVIPYVKLGLVAAATMNRQHAQTILDELNKVGLSYEGNVSFWKAPLGKIHTTVSRRLDAISEAHKAIEETDRAECIKEVESSIGRPLDQNDVIDPVNPIDSTDPTNSILLEDHIIPVGEIVVNDH